MSKVWVGRTLSPNVAFTLFVAQQNSFVETGSRVSAMRMRFTYVEREEIRAWKRRRLLVLPSLGIGYNVA